MSHLLTTYIRIATAFQKEYTNCPVAITSFLLSMPSEMLHFIYYRYQYQDNTDDHSKKPGIVPNMQYSYFIQGLKFVGFLNKIYDNTRPLQSFIGPITAGDLFYSLRIMTLNQRITLIEMFSCHLYHPVESIPLKDARDWFYYLNNIMSNDDSRICFLKLIWSNNLSEHLDNKWQSIQDPVMFVNGLDQFNRSQLYSNIRGSEISLTDIRQFINLVLYVSTYGCLPFLENHLDVSQKNIGDLFARYKLQPGLLVLSLNESSYQILCTLYTQGVMY